MRAKEYLLQIQDIRTKIENKKERLERIANILTSPAVGELTPDKVQTSIALDKQESMIAEKKILEDEIQRLMYEEAVLMIKIGRQIDQLAEPLHSRILHLRYEENQPLWIVAQSVNYSYSHIKRLHGQALLEFEKMYLRNAECLDKLTRSFKQADEGKVQYHELIEADE